MRAPLALLLLVGSALGCAGVADSATPLVRVHAAKDLMCPDLEIRIEEQLGGHFKAVGCGRKAYYHAACEGVSCVVEPDQAGAIPWRDRPSPDEPTR